MRLAEGGSERTLDSDGDVGLHTSIAIRDDGLPIISYYSRTNGSLKIYRCDDMICGSGSDKTLDDGGFVGSFTSIATRHNGLPVISYFDDTRGNLKVYRCDDPDCDSGSHDALDDTLDRVGQYTSVAIRNDGLPIIAYYDVSNSSLRLYRCLNSDCDSDGDFQTQLDNSGDAGRYASIAIAEGGAPIISYRDSSLNYLRVYRCLDSNCSSGSRAGLASGGLYSSIAVRENGLPIISHVHNGSLRVYDCADPFCETGSDRLIEGPSTWGTIDTSIEISAGNLPVISSHERTYDDGDDSTIRGELRLHRCGDPKCEN